MRNRGPTMEEPRNVRPQARDVNTPACFSEYSVPSGTSGQTNDSAVSADAGPYFNGTIVKLALP